MIIKFKDAIATRNKLTKNQEKEIKKLYKQWADELNKKIRYYAKHPAKSSVVKERQLKELQKMLRKSADNVSNAVYSSIRKNAFLVAEAVDKEQIKWLKDIGFLNANAGRINRIEHRVVSNILNGKIYKNGWNLSKSIWGDNEKTLKDLHTLIAKGVAENNPVEEIAKDLEVYVNPRKKKPWNKRIVFKSDTPKKGFTYNPKAKKYEQVGRIYKRKVDYNAQRVARTVVQHSYQQAFVEATANNPFITEYVWNATGSRPCPLCEDRDGMHYKKSELPLDHPQGQCTIDVETSNTMEQDLANWFKSPEGTFPDIDNFAKEFR